MCSGLGGSGPFREPGRLTEMKEGVREGDLEGKHWRKQSGEVMREKLSCTALSGN